MKIVTVTPHTALDRLVVLTRGAASPGVCFPAGKGINVARTVATLCFPVVALGFVGEAEQELFASMAALSLAIRLIPVAGATRTNTTTFDADRKETDHRRTQGFRVTAEDWERLAGALDATVEAGDMVIFSGSVPPGSDRDAYGRLIRLCHQRHAPSVLDSSGGELREGIQARPLMAKPNLEELAELCGERGGIDSWREEQIATAARRLQQMGTALVVVSRGAAGVVAVSEEPGAWSGSVALDRPPSETGSVGSGDALVAGIAVALLRGLSFEEALCLGIACGAANVLRAGPGVCDPADIERLSGSVVLRKMNFHREGTEGTEACAEK